MKLKKLRVVFENIDGYDVSFVAVKEFHSKWDRKDN